MSRNDRITLNSDDLATLATFADEFLSYGFTIYRGNRRLNNTPASEVVVGDKMLTGTFASINFQLKDLET